MKLTTKLAALAVLCFSPAFASAGIIEFSFTSSGTAVSTGGCGLLCQEISVSGVATEIGDNVPGTNSWNFSGQMSFIGLVLVGATLDGTWQFIDTISNNSLFGTFSMLLLPESLTVRTGTVNYDVTGGTGLFAGAIGDGASLIRYILGSPTTFLEYGVMRVLVDDRNGSPVSVPEPGILSLMLAGLAGVAIVSRRRKKALAKALAA